MNGTPIATKPRSHRGGHALVGLLVLWLCSVPSGAAPATELSDQLWALDGPRSHAGFQIRAVWMFTVSGQLGALGGSVRIDGFHNTATVDATIDAGVVSMRNPEYVAWLKSAEFFDVQHYPQIHFVSEPTPLPRLRYGGELRGTLEVRGIRQAVIFELLPGTCAGRLGHDCPVRAEGTIQRSAFGMTTRRLTLSDKVELDFTIYVNDASTAAAANAE